MTSPYRTHREKVLGHHSTASWMRRVVLALWSDGNPMPSFARLQTLDDAHFAALNDMLAHYRQVGENDPELAKLAADVEARMYEERAATERAGRFEAWCADVRAALAKLGREPELVDDRYNWFESQFDAGRTPDDAARAAEPLPLPANE